SPLVGYIAGASGLLLKTTDGGASWTVSETETDQSINALAFLTEDEGWFGCYRAEFGGVVLMRTRDGARSWTPCPIEGDSYPLCFSFPSHDSGFIGGYGGMLLRTGNRG